MSVPDWPYFVFWSLWLTLLSYVGIQVVNRLNHIILLLEK